MRFLLDAQLPPALARFLVTRGHDAEHVFDLSMHLASDGDIWRLAEARGAVVITKDEDFATRVSTTSNGPAVVKLCLNRASLYGSFLGKRKNVCGLSERPASWL